MSKLEVIFLLWIVAGCTCSGQTPESCSARDSAACAKSDNRIIEIPEGPMDGKNRVFTLSSNPISPADVHLFLDGLELVQGSDFDVNGQTVSLLKAITPEKEDVLRASYQAQFLSVSSNHVISTFQSIDSVARASLLRSILTESNSNQIVQSISEKRHLDLSLIKRATRDTSVRALSLMSRDIVDYRKTQRNNDDSNSRRSGRLSQGIEGLGDILVPSPYSALLGFSSPRTAGDKSKQELGSRGVLTDKLRSFQLLRQRLNESDVQ